MALLPSPQALLIPGELGGAWPTSYDPGLLPHVAARHRRVVRARRWAILGAGLGLAWGLWWDAWRGGPELAKRQAERAVWLRERLVALGPTFIKIGQMLSTRPDLLPRPYVEAMALLQDQVPAFPNEEARAIIRAELGHDPDRLFATFAPHPIAAASIGQVYKARRHDGREVVVKVQRPQLLGTIWTDLAVLRPMAQWVEARWLQGRNQLTEILDEFALSLFEQANYEVEAGFARRFSANFQGFGGIDAPAIHEDLLTPRVMVMDFIEGVKPTDLVALEKLGIQFQDLVRTGVRATIKQILEDGFFHADVHPGNLFVQADGTLVYIDFGMVGLLPEADQERIVDIFLHSVHRDYQALIDDFVALGFLPKGSDPHRLAPVAQAIFEAQYGVSGRRLTVGEVFRKVTEALEGVPYRLPAKIAFVLRTIITLEGIVHTLWPEFRFLEVAGPYAAKILLTDAKAGIRRKLVDELFREGRFDPSRLSKLMGTASKEPSFRFGEVAPSVLRYLTSPDGKRVREALLDLSLQAPSAAGAPPGEPPAFGWQLIVDRAQADPDWRLDDLLEPVISFLPTEEGVMLLIRLAERSPAPEASASGQAPGAGLQLGLLVMGRSVSSSTLARLLEALAEALRQPGAPALQPAIERLAAWLGTEAGLAFFDRLGDRLLSWLPAAGPGPEGPALPGAQPAPPPAAGVAKALRALIAVTARTPGLDPAPLLRAFAANLLRPEAKPWHELIQRGAGGHPGDWWQAIQPLIEDGRLQAAELAGSALAFFLSPDGHTLREEVIKAVSTRAGGVVEAAKGVWHTASAFVNAFRTARQQHLRPASEGGGASEATSEGAGPEA